MPSNNNISQQQHQRFFLCFTLFSGGVLRDDEDVMWWGLLCVCNNSGTREEVKEMCYLHRYKPPATEAAPLQMVLHLFHENNELIKYSSSTKPVNYFIHS